jgi:uncharacterized protein
MDLTGEQRIAADRQTVWRALNDPTILKASIPGCEELSRLSDTQMQAVVALKVGPISARFQGKVEFSEIDAPHGYRITGSGQGGMAGHAKGGALVRLEADGDETLLRYDVSAQVGGKLAQLGGRMIDATARSMSAAFFGKFAEEIARRQNPEALAKLPVERPVATALPAEARRQAAWLWFVCGLLLGVLVMAVIAEHGRIDPSRFDMFVIVSVMLALVQGYLLGSARKR